MEHYGKSSLCPRKILQLHCHDVLDLLGTRDSQWQKLTYLASSKSRQVSDNDV